MPQRTSHRRASCPIARPLDAIGDGWSLLIVRDVLEGTQRFGDLQRSLGLAKNILAARLRNLIAHDILTTVPARDGTRHHTYAATEKGRGLFPLLVALRQWSEEFYFTPGEPHVRLVDRMDGRPVPRMVPRAHDGRPLAPEDTVVQPAPRAPRSGAVRRK